jgi:hypothetical protein
MSTLLLSILLVVLVFIGIKMRGRVERFKNHDSPSTTPPASVIVVEDVRSVSEIIPTSLMVDTLGRDQAAVRAANPVGPVIPPPATAPAPAGPVTGCPLGLTDGPSVREMPVGGCPYRHHCKCECPDMSKYIKKDEIPCWNCTLP